MFFLLRLLSVLFPHHFELITFTKFTYLASASLCCSLMLPAYSTLSSLSCSWLERVQDLWPLINSLSLFSWELLHTLVVARIAVVCTSMLHRRRTRKIGYHFKCRSMAVHTSLSACVCTYVGKPLNFTLILSSVNKPLLVLLLIIIFWCDWCIDALIW